MLERELIYTHLHSGHAKRPLEIDAKHIHSSMHSRVALLTDSEHERDGCALVSPHRLHRVVRGLAIAFHTPPNGASGTERCVGTVHETAARACESLCRCMHSSRQCTWFVPSHVFERAVTAFGRVTSNPRLPVGLRDGDDHLAVPHLTRTTGVRRALGGLPVVHVQGA